MTRQSTTHPLRRSMFPKKSRVVAAALAGASGLSFASAQAAQYIYTPAAGTTDNWSTGADWSATPVSSSSTRLTFVASNSTVFAAGLVNASNNDIAGTGTGGALILNRLDLQGAGPSTGGNVSITLNGNALEFVNNGTTPILNLLASTGGSPSVSYTVNNNLILDNTTNFSGGGSATFTFGGTISGAGNMTRVSGSTLTFNGSLSQAGGMTLNSGTTILNAANSYTGDTTINSGAILSVGASGTLGGNVAGNDVNVGGGAALRLSAAGNIGSNQFLNLRYSLTTEPILSVSSNFAPVITSVPVANSAGILPTSGGVFAVNTTGYNAVTSLANLGNGGMFLGTTGGGTIVNAALGAGSGNVYRLGGGGSTSTLVLAGTGTDNLLSGNNSVQVGDSRSSGVVDISNGGNNYTGGTLVTGASTLQTDVTTSTTPFGSTATATSRGITLDNGTLKIGSATLAAGQTVAVAGYDLYVPSTGVLALTHHSGTVTFTANSINRVGNGVLEITPTSGYISSSSPGTLGVSEKVLVSGTAPAVVNGMVAPYIIDGGMGVPQAGLSNNFLTYDSVKGFIDATYTQTDTTSGVFPTGVTSTDIVGLNATSNGKTYTTGGNVSLYALRMTTGTYGQTVTLGNAATPDTMTIGSGGLILAVGGGSTTYKINENLAFGNAEGIIGPGGVSNTFSGAITGSGGLTFYGTGAFNLANITGVTGGVNVEGGTVRVGSTWGTGNAVSVNGTGSLMLNLSGGANISQAVTSLSGNGRVSVDGTGNCTLAIDGGTSTGTSTFSGAIGGAANLSLVKLGSTTQILAGTNSYTGTTTISGGTLQLGDGVNSDGAIAGNSIINNAALVFANPTAQTYSGVISGSGSFTKSGNGVLTLTAANTYGGNTAINGGTLALTSAGAVANSPAIAVAGGATLDLSALTSSFTLAAGHSLSGAGAVLQNLSNSNGKVLIDNGKLSGSLVLNGTVAGSGSIDPGDSPGILTADQVNPTGGLSFNFEFTTSGQPTYANPTASGNDLLHLTDATTPFTTSLTAANAVNVYFDLASLGSGDYQGGFFTDQAGDFLSSIQNATFSYYLSDPNGAYSYNGVKYDLLDPSKVTMSTQAATANFGAGAVNGRIADFAVSVPEPASLALLGVSSLALLIRRRRRAV